MGSVQILTLTNFMLQPASVVHSLSHKNKKAGNIPTLDKAVLKQVALN